MNTQPFYIDAPDFDENAPLSLQLHLLCDALNRLGHEAYVNGTCVRLNGNLWTPRLTPPVQAAHYRAGKVPITITGRIRSDRDGTKDIGVLGQYIPEGRWIDGREILQGQIRLSTSSQDTETLELLLPVADPGVFKPAEQGMQSGRSLHLVFAEHFQLHDGKLRPEHRTALDISPRTAGQLPATERAKLLQQARCLYVYETATIVTEARLCGCPVVYVTNDLTLVTPAEGVWGTEGTRTNFMPETPDQQLDGELESFRGRYVALYEGHMKSIQAFAQRAIAMAEALAKDGAASEDVIWPAEVLETLEEWIADKKDRARNADQAKYRRLQKQYQTWRKRSSLREIDAQVYAEHIASGEVTAPAVMIYADTQDMEPIARTLDSLSAGLWQPATLWVIAPFACPVSPEELGEQFHWVQRDSTQCPLRLNNTDLPPWCLLIDAGTTLEPHALIEFALAMHMPGVLLAYCDDDTETPVGHLPHFKPDLNIEWLRCFNYLGGAVAVQSSLWSQHQNNDRFHGAYGLALSLATDTLRAQSVAHIDTVLAHLTPSGNQEVNVNRESDELAQLKLHVLKQGLQINIQPSATWGNWQIEYLPNQSHAISLVIPTGIQLGYLRCLLDSLISHGDPRLAEVILVTNEDQREDVQATLSQAALNVRAKVIVAPASDAGYNHSAALNAGIREASSELVLIMDDDTECLQSHWLQTLHAYFDQSDIACAAPRLVLQMDKDATLQGGPLLPGADGLFRTYVGERSLLEEKGMFSRLQASQDVPAVAGHCFVLRRQTWVELNGFDEFTFNLYHSVADFCLRARQRGWRHVWTPVSSVLHHGAKTLNFVQRETETALNLRNRAIREHEQWQERWVAYLGQDGSYSRHLSLHTFYEIDTDIVLDWPRNRRDRPKILALPISSGSGQYRVVEPLDALQDAALARTCVVFPRARNILREPTVLEIARARPDTLVVQHSIGDHHFRQLRGYRRSCPSLFIVQMVDDLFRDLPAKHRLHNVHQREGELRMREAISLCDRLIVSTQPLADAYSAYCPDVRVMPNCLDEKAWNGLRNKPNRQPRERLRVGWAGAMQHLDDLEMIAEVVRELAAEVDWIFMGMCPDVLRPYVKEFHPFVSYADYPAKLATLDLDIAIAPLQDNRFNESKSNLRLLEYGAMGWPVICSDVYPFRTGNPPVLRLPNEAKAWIDALRQLMADPTRREQMAENLYQWVRERHFLMRRVNEWSEALDKGTSQK